MNTFLRSGVVALLLTAGLAVPAHADDWGKMALISSTMGTNAGRLCAGAADTNRPSDVGCPTYAPSVTTAGDVSVTGNLSASKFIGDGSALTGVAAASSDRIVSGSTSMLAVSASGFISVTQGGTNTAWFDPTKGLVALGVSTTGTVSGTAGYFSGNVGVGITSPLKPFHLVATAAGTGVMRLQNNSSTGYTAVDLNDHTGTLGGFFGWGNSGAAGVPSSFYFGTAFSNPVILQTNSIERMRVDGSGNVGIGTTAPGTTLEVQGSSIGNWQTNRGNVSVITSDAQAANIGGLLSLGGKYDASGNIASFGLIKGGKENATDSNFAGYLAFGTHTSGDWPSEKMRITSAGKVGIGTITPTATLQVSGSFTVSTSAQTTTPSLYVGTDGNVGVGTNTPDSTLTVMGTGSIRSVGTGLENNTLFNVSSGNGAVDLTGLFIRNAPNVGHTAFRIHDNWTDGSGGNIVSIANGSGNKFLINNAGKVGIGTTAPQATLQVSGSFTVSTSAQTTTPTLYADTSGNVGIGTTNPSQPLSVQAPAATNNVGIFKGQDARLTVQSDNDGWRFRELYFTNPSDNESASIQTSGDHANPNNDTHNYISFLLNNSSKMFIGKSGNIGISTTNPNAKLDVYGTVSATNFVGNGSGLTGVVAGSSDRIVSGTNNATSMVAISSSGYISITQAGANAAWFDPARGLVALGISTTGGISGSTGYFYGNVGVGTAAPSQKLDVSGNASISGMLIGGNGILGNSSNGLMRFDGSNVALSSAAGGALYIQRDQGADIYLAMAGTNKVGIGSNSAGSLLSVNGAMSVGSLYQTTVAPTNGAIIQGNVGIGTTTPGKTLDVSGSANISGTVKIAGLGTEACNPGAYGTMRYTNGNLELCSPGN